MTLLITSLECGFVLKLCLPLLMTTTVICIVGESSQEFAICNASKGIIVCNAHLIVSLSDFTEVEISPGLLPYICQLTWPHVCIAFYWLFCVQIAVRPHCCQFLRKPRRKDLGTLKTPQIK